MKKQLSKISICTSQGIRHRRSPAKGRRGPVHTSNGDHGRWRNPFNQTSLHALTVLWHAQNKTKATGLGTDRTKPIHVDLTSGGRRGRSIGGRDARCGLGCRERPTEAGRVMPTIAATPMSTPVCHVRAASSLALSDSEAFAPRVSFTAQPLQHTHTAPSVPFSKSADHARIGPAHSHGRARTATWRRG